MNKTLIGLLGAGALLSVLSLFASETAVPALHVPPRETLLSPLVKSHPRLLVSDAGFAELKKTIGETPQLQAWQAKLDTEADQILKADPSRYEIPDGLRLLATSRQVVNRVYILGLLYHLEGRKEFAQRAWKELDAAAHFPDWNTRHFLDTAEMTHAFAIGYDWFYDLWSPEQRQLLREAIVEKGLTPALKLYREHTYWTRMRHNWNQVCNGGIGMGALAIAEAEPDLSAEVLHSALESLPLAMEEFAPDGAWKEGPGYWNYATIYNVIFLAGLRTALGSDFGLSDMPAFRDTGLFPLYLTGPLGRTFNYADGGDRAIRAPQMFWLARTFERPVFAWYERKLAAPSPLDLLWYDPRGNSPQAEELPLDKYFRGAEVVTLRSDWENPQALFVGFKAGDNRANHSHLDLGSFVFDALGARWAMDLGSDDYNLPGYFGKQRWEYYRLRAEGQNTLAINPDAGPDQDPSAAARMTKFYRSAERSFAIADLSPVYKKHAKKVLRGLALEDRRSLVVQDEIQAEKPAEVWWFMHTPASVKIEDDGHRAILKQVGKELVAELKLPTNAAFELMDAQPLPTSPHPAKQAKNEGAVKLAVHLSGVTDARIVVCLRPGGAETTERVPLVPLGKW